MPLAMKARAASSAALGELGEGEAAVAVDQPLEGAELGGGPLDDGGERAGVEVEALCGVVCHAWSPSRRSPAAA